MIISERNLRVSSEERAYCHLISYTKKAVGTQNSASSQQTRTISSCVIKNSRKMKWKRIICIDFYIGRVRVFPLRYSCIKLNRVCVVKFDEVFFKRSQFEDFPAFSVESVFYVFCFCIFIS